MFDFNPANYINAGKPPFDGLVDSGTIEAWIKPTNLPTIISVIRKDHDFNIFVLNSLVKAEWFKGGSLGLSIVD